VFGTPGGSFVGAPARKSAAPEDPFDLFGGLGTTEQHTGRGEDLLGGLGGPSGELSISPKGSRIAFVQEMLKRSEMALHGELFL